MVILQKTNKTFNALNNPENTMDVLTLIPGMANYMEDDIDVNVNVGMPEETAVEAEETADAAVEVESTAADAQDDADTAEEMFAVFESLERMEAYRAEHGIDRAFVQLCCYDGSVASKLLTLPQAESIDVVGDPNSSLSIAAGEGFGEALKSVWEFIKKVATRVKEFVMRIVEAVKSRFMSLDKNIGRLREAAKNRVDSPEQLKGVKAEVYTRQALEAIGAKNVNVALAEAEKAGAELRKSADLLMSGKASGGDTVTKTIETIVDTLVKTGEKFKKGRTAAKKVPLDKISWADAKAMLDSAASLKVSIDTSVGVATTLKTASEQFVKVAEAMKTRGDKNGEEIASLARKLTSYLNRVSGSFSGIMAQAHWMASQYVHTAGLRIMRGSKA